MKHIRLLLLASLLFAMGCKKEADVRPLADINLLTGRWVSINNPNYEIEFNPNTRQGIYTKVLSGNIYGSKVGDITWKNLEAVDTKTFKGEGLYRGTAGYFLYAEMSLQINGDIINHVSYLGSTGGLTVSGQTNQYKRVN